MCKAGKALCGNRVCPLLSRIKLRPKLQNLSETFFGPSPNIFIGRAGWPNVAAGPLGALEQRPDIDNPAAWWGQPYGHVVELRSMVLRSKQSQNIKSKSSFVELLQEIALSQRPPDIEARFKERPKYKLTFSEIVQPMGPVANLKSVKICENVHIPKAVDSIVNDEMLASEASHALFDCGMDVYKISTILSSGALGLRQRRQLVPTRWSITAVDDMIAKHLMEKVRSYPEMGSFSVFESHYLGNHFVILMMPGQWEFENFEAWAPGSFWAQQLKDTQIVAEYEPHWGRTAYAESQAGGYYASRLACVEYLAKIKKQARVVVFREIDSSYSVPLGVWVVRETARHALKNTPMIFESQAEAMDYVSKRLSLPIKNYIAKSAILGQLRLERFLN